MRFWVIWACPLILFRAFGEGADRFSFQNTSDFSQGIMSPSDWGQVACEDPDTCPGWPSRWHLLSPFIPDNITNTCYDCSDKIRGECQYHKQSPIDLWRNITASRDCKDRHRMHFQKGNCRFEDMRFEILPHVLRANQPDTPCSFQPNIDFSFGFPDPWMLAYTDIVVPSLHRQDGKQYDGEVVMSHTYSVDKEDKRIGNVAFFLEKGTKDDHYDFLELYIQRWQQEHEQIMDDCSNLRRRTQSRTATKGEGLDPRSLASSPRTQKLDYPHFSREFQPYDWYIQTRTHYYFRYEGSEPEPPCVEGVHWRVLKNPVTVAPSQIAALENLLANRIDPNTCLPYTAVRIEADGSVHNNRPIQKRRPSHLVVYCECEDWESNTLSDKKYCSLPPEERGVIVRTKKPIGPKTRSPTTTPTASPTFTSEECNNCPAGKSRYLCRLFEVLHPDETPFCT